MKLNEFFKEAFYINLDRRTDRREEFESEMKSIGLEGWVQRVPAIPYEKGMHFKENCDQCDKHAACGMTHKRIIQYAKDNKLENILILEDDIIFHNEGERPGIEIIEDSLDQLTQIGHWDVMYLSAFTTESDLRQVAPNLITSDTCLTAHAYGINHTVYDTLLEYNPTTDSPLDGWIGNRHFIKKYVTYPLAIYQRDGVSDLDAYGKSTGIGPYINNYNKPVTKLF